MGRAVFALARGRTAVGLFTGPIDRRLGDWKAGEFASDVDVRKSTRRSVLHSTRAIRIYTVDVPEKAVSGDYPPEPYPLSAPAAATPAEAKSLAAAGIRGSPFSGRTQDTLPNSAN